MYQQIWTDYLSRITKGTPTARTLHVGQALRFLRKEGHISRDAVSTAAGMGLTRLKDMETEKEAYNSWDNIQNLATALRIPTEKLIKRSREEFPHNFFVTRKDMGVRLDYDGCSIYPLSPPITSQSDFLIVKVNLQPKKNIWPLLHPEAKEIAGYVLEGYLKIQFGNQTYTLQPNQSFYFDGTVPHGFFNESEQKNVEFFLCINPPPRENPTPNLLQNRKEGLDLAYALDYVRRKASPIPSMPLPWNMLSKMTGIPIRHLMHLSSGKTEIVYWDKLEALAQGTGIPLEEIMDIATGKNQGRFEICNYLYRGTTDFEDSFGMKIFSAARLGTARRQFSIGQVFLYKRRSPEKPRKKWHFKTNAFMCAVLQDGEYFIEYGKRKKEKLETGDAVYFDANEEFSISNQIPQESKFLLFSHPPLF